MKNNYTPLPQKNTIVIRVALFWFLQISLMSALIENTCTLLCTPIFHSIVICVLSESLGSYRYVVRKGRTLCAHEVTPRGPYSILRTTALAKAIGRPVLCT